MKESIWIGKGKNGYWWETNIVSKDTMPVKVFELDKETSEGLWYDGIKLFVIQTVDSKARDIVDHIVITPSQANQIIKELQELLRERGGE